MHGEGWEYKIHVPAEPVPAWRILESDAVTDRAFWSHLEMEIREPDTTEYRRGWPRDAEDHLLFRGISTWNLDDRARQHALDINATREESGLPPKFTHIVEVKVSGHQGEAIEDEVSREPGHITVFADARKLAARASSQGRPIPITPEQA